MKRTKKEKLLDQLDVAWQSGRTAGLKQGLEEGRRQATEELDADIRKQKMEAITKVLSSISQGMSAMAGLADNLHGVL
jgi:uncharacterized lipoprotein YehR (DUF1307 family)